MVNKNISLGDRYAEISVLVVTVIALLAGWFYKSGVENRSISFNSEGITAAIPQGWLQTKPTGDEILHVTDITSPGGYGTTYVLRKVPIAVDATSSQVSSLVALDHGQVLTGFRVLDQREVTVFGENAYELSYVFVATNPDVTHNDIPNVVRGVDYIFIKGAQAIVASFQADEKNYDLDLGHFQSFLESVSY